MYTDLFAARIPGFFFLLKVSELVSLCWADVSVESKDGRDT